MESREKLRILVNAFIDASKNVPSKPVNKEIIDENKPLIKFIDEAPLEPPKVFKAGIHKDKGWLYYVDKDGDIARAEMHRKEKGETSSKKKSTKKTKEKVYYKKVANKKTSKKKTSKKNKTTKPVSKKAVVGKLATQILELEDKLNKIKKTENKTLYNALKNKINELKKRINS